MEEFQVHGSAADILGAPDDGISLSCLPTLAAIGPQQEKISGGTLRGLGGVPEDANVNKAAVWHRFIGKCESAIAAIDGWRRRAGVVDENRCWEYGQAAVDAIRRER